MPARSNSRRDNTGRIQGMTCTSSYVRKIAHQIDNYKEAVYINDILVHHDTEAGCAALTKEVQQVLRQWNPTINESKSVYIVRP